MSSKDNVLLGFDRWNERLAGQSVSTADGSRIRMRGNLASSEVVVRPFCSTEEVCGVEGSNAMNSATCPDGERNIGVPSKGGCAGLIGCRDISGFRSGVMNNSPLAARFTLNLNTSRRGEGACNAGKSD